MKIMAELIAMIAHKGQIRKDGSPYIEHCRKVAFMAQGVGARGFVVGMLHDTVEDSGGLVTLDFLKRMGFDEVIIDAVDAITRQKDEKYKDYIIRVKANKLAATIKYIDLLDNLSNLDRIQYASLVKRYEEAKEVLSKE